MPTKPDTPNPSGLTEVASLHLAVNHTGTGMLVSLTSTGRFSGPSIDRRFYSIGQLPPDVMDPEEFWSPILAFIGRLMAGDIADRTGADT